MAALLKKMVLFLALILVLIGAGGYIFIKTHEVFAANFADDVLRPLIGGKTTIALEALFFKFQDTINKATYGFGNPIKGPFSKNGTTLKKINILESELFTLDPIAPLYPFQPITNEGIWTPIDIQMKQDIMAKTFVRPDKDRPFAIVALVKMNMSHLILSAVAGIKEPGGKLNPGKGHIPDEVQKSNLLVAAFNGGFQQKDGYYGMIIVNKVYLPLKKNLATLIMYTSAKPTIINYQGQKLKDDMIAVRQNGPLLLENSQIVTSSTAWNMQTWGLTTTNSMYTWRSGIGVTKNGNLIFAVGPSLVPETLAQALLMAGAVNAMQLDINPVWVRFVSFHSLGNETYTYDSLIKGMINGGYQYLHGYNKDFFYVTKK